MDGTVISGVMTVASLLTFLGIVVWAYSKGNKARFEQLARLPLDNDE